MIEKEGVRQAQKQLLKNKTLVNPWGLTHLAEQEGLDLTKVGVILIAIWNNIYYRNIVIIIVTENKISAISILIK